ncbi:Neutrophil cytosol factor 2 p67phox [Neofusicoccum parvum]|uniref:Neutrophil cytosol factor 2 p67phox n=2 Tax=Neofusicoccum parvum TaxID=310453 RepID=A0ACB5RZ53_9PEZI|nr:putative actin binding protein [Neofusicoccum parvum UCRNP2]GME25411.1 Neutrophil cytosol factor 2 p67phox [Neofusicoccum parvum]GME30983.1 Neutrophil cytosol factor 2 p67phox [Neofusicoccum parvum]
MASLNTSTNGPTIRRSYEGVVNGALPSGAAAASPTYGQWALFSVSAPLANAFQADTGKESVLKVQTTGEGELADLIDELSDGRIQFAFVKVKDPNTGLPKNVLIAWCGEGVPERTKGYFNTHLAAVSKLLHGYHVQVTARSESALSPEAIVQKVSDASGAKYSAGDAPPPVANRPPPPVASKPVFTPTRVGGGGSGFNPLARSRAAPSGQSVDNDGWGADAPPVTRSQLEKVESAYKPTKVNLADLTRQNEDATRSAPARGDTPGDVVRGGYQPIGKVDIAAIRKQAAESGQLKDERPAPVKGSYEPIGKVDIAAIRAKAQGPGASPANISPAPTGGSAGDDEAPKSLAERSSAFKSQPLTSMPKPKVANKFGNTGAFTGTKPPAPAFAPKPLAAAAPVGTASKTFADEGGKTPAQIWAEKKARERGLSGSGDLPPPPAAQPIASQQSGSGGWKSGYTGKSWAPVQTTHTGASNLSAQRTGEVDHPQEEAPASPAGGVGALRDRFKEAPPMGAATSRPVPPPQEEPMPPPMDLSSKPNAARGVPIPGLPTRPAADERPEEEHVSVPPPPAQPRSPTPPSPDLRPSSPIRIVQPVARNAEPEDLEPAEQRSPPPAMPTESISAAVSAAKSHLPEEPQVEAHDPARGAGIAAAEASFGAGAGQAGQAGGKRAVAQYDYEKAEDNEIELAEGELITNIDMVDEDWWMGQNSRGEAGLFPSNYVELVEDDDEPAAPAPAAAPAPPAAPPAASGSKAPTATALYDYEAAEDNELSFPDGATINGIEFPDEDWWFGEFGGKTGLFPANYVQLDE